MNVALRKMGAVELDGKDRLALAFTAACGVAISSGILASLIYLLLDLSSTVEIYEKIATCKSTFSLAVQATLGTICGYWRASSRPPGNDRPFVIVRMEMSL
jgi:hypothetical protein